MARRNLKHFKGDRLNELMLHRLGRENVGAPSEGLTQGKGNTSGWIASVRFFPADGGAKL
jgi:hypothetical protein